MVRLQECPRCGAGIGHADSQCWRCGEMFKPGIKKEVPKPGNNASSGIKDMRDLRPKEAPKQQSALRNLTESYGGREKELQDREKELREEMDNLEAEYKELEKAAKELEDERSSIEELKQHLKEREDDLDAMAIVLQNALRTAEDYHKGAQAGTSDPKLLERLLSADRELKPILESERARIRKEMEREMADQLNRIAQLEAELKAACEQLHEGEADFEGPKIDVKAVIQEVAEELQGQIGAGLDHGLDDRKYLTHMDRLDQILSGGIPVGSVILVNGPAGSMKTTLTYNILHACAVKDRIKGMYFSLEQDRDSLIRQMSRLGMDRQLSLDDLIVADMVDLRRSMEGQKGDWRNILMRYVANVMEENPFQLLALDSLESFMAMSEHTFTRVEIQDLFDTFRSMGLTTLVISETPLQKLEENDHMELYVADGAIELVMKEVGDSHIQRWLRCVKLRGANIDPRYYCLMHTGGSFVLSVPMMRSVPESGEE